MNNQIEIKKKIFPFNKSINVSSDKSLSIRCILLSSIAAGKSKIFNLLNSEDVLNTIKTVRKLGIKCVKKKNYVLVYGVGINGFKINKNTTLDAGNSGTLARCILGLCSGREEKINLIGDKSLSRRDFSRVIEPLKLFGAKIKSNKGSLPLQLSGSNLLRPITFIENKGSAQVKTCILLSALNTAGITKIKCKKSRTHTELLLKYLNYPIQIRKTKMYDIINIKGLHQFGSFNYEIPGDISSASFFIVLTLLAEKSKLLIKKTNINPTRIGIIKILKKMNAKISLINKRNYKGELIGDIKIMSTSNLKSINCPKSLNSSAIDEFLLIFLVAARAKGVSKFSGLSELNKKESPRLNIAINILKMMGIKVVRKKDDIKIFGNPSLILNKNYQIENFFKDHRVFMMSTIAALTFGGKRWVIKDKNSINTSFPDFLKILNKLGAKIN